MLILIIEIVLTIWVWRQGWKAWALLPLAIAVGVGFVIGFVHAVLTGGTDLEKYMPYLALLDLGVVVALLVMGMKGRSAPTVDTAPYPAVFPSEVGTSENRLP